MGAALMTVGATLVGSGVMAERGSPYRMMSAVHDGSGADDRRSDTRRLWSDGRAWIAVPNDVRCRFGNGLQSVLQHDVAVAATRINGFQQRTHRIHRWEVTGSGSSSR